MNGRHSTWPDGQSTMIYLKLAVSKNSESDVTRGYIPEVICACRGMVNGIKRVRKQLRTVTACLTQITRFPYKPLHYRRRTQKNSSNLWIFFADQTFSMFHLQRASGNLEFHGKNSSNCLNQLVKSGSHNSPATCQRFTYSPCLANYREKLKRNLLQRFHVSMAINKLYRNH